MFRRLGSALAVLAIFAGAAVAVPSAATAATVPSPVLPIPTLPSAGSGQGMIAEQLYDFWRALTAAPKTAPVPPPVAPISPLAAVARIGGAALIAANVGWGIGQGGLRILAATGVTADYDTMICSSPDWYKGVNSFFMFGNVPDCKMSVVAPNGDVMPVGAVYRVVFEGITYVAFKIPGSTTTCTMANARTDLGAYPPKYFTQWRLSPTSWDFNNTLGPIASTTCNAYKASVPGSNGEGVQAVANPNQPLVEFRVVYDVAGQTKRYSEASTPVEAPDPVRTPTCTIKWKDGSTTTGTGQTYNESTGLPLTSPGLGCEAAFVSQPGAGPDLLPDEITVDSQVDGGAKTQISKSVVPDFTAEQAKSFYPTKPGAGLVLLKTVNGVTDSCNTWAADCSNWWTQTANGTQTSTSTGTYRCTFGGDTVTLNECGPYRHTFDTKTETPTITDPATGLEKPWTAKPSVGNSTDPGVGLDPGGQCFADGWSSVQNPVDWVLLPVKCALVWAFVPRASAVDDAFEGMQERWDQSLGGSVSAVFGSIGEALGAPGASCSGLPFHLEGPGWVFNTVLFQACDEPMAGVATTINLILTFVILYGGSLAVVRYVSAVFGFIPFGGGDLIGGEHESRGVRFK